ncbi:MAG: HAD family hydrolase [Verrucomicrobia bacterium]|nr:HAD family hydrolase [Verrucomicrobiota bacterium]MCH8513346.1 HAD family hydrolase [Kiritimatiellia bacterium]
MESTDRPNACAVLFDWENTLLDLRATREAFFVIQWQSFLDELLHIPARTYVDAALRHLQTAANPGMAYRRVVEELKLPAELAQLLANDFHTQQGGAPRLFPGALNLMRHLSVLYKTGLIGQGNVGFVQHTLKRTGIAPYLHHVQVNETNGGGKPGTEIFRKALRALKVPAHQTVYVGDDLETDLLAAAESGLRTIWKRPDHMPRQMHPDHADAVIDDIRDLPHALRDFAGIPAG